MDVVNAIVIEKWFAIYAGKKVTDNFIVQIDGGDIIQRYVALNLEQKEFLLNLNLIPINNFIDYNHRKIVSRGEVGRR